jgi:hypothetical protein
MEWMTDPAGKVIERYSLTAGRCSATAWNAGRHGYAAKVGYGGMTTAHYGFNTLEDAQAWCLMELAELRATGRCESTAIVSNDGQDPTDA